MHQPRDQLGVHPDIVAIGASAGGVDVIPRLLSLLPSDLPASVLVVLHRPTEQISILRGILARKSNMHVTIPHEGDILHHGICYLGEPHRHLTVAPHSRVHLLGDGFTARTVSMRCSARWLATPESGRSASFFRGY